MQLHFYLSSVYGSGRDHFSRRTFLGPRVDAPCILQGILIHCNLCGLEFLVLRYASVVYCFYRSLCKKAAFLEFKFL